MGSSKRTARRTRQTQLNFTPLPSSSPAAAHLSPHVRDRASAVGYEGSPSPLKRQKIKDEDRTPDKDNSQTALPTPVRSSQPHPLVFQNNSATQSPTTHKKESQAASDSDSDAEPVHLTQRKPRDNTFMNSSLRKSEKKLSFGNLDKKAAFVEEGSKSSSEENMPISRRNFRSSQATRVTRSSASNHAPVSPSLETHTTKSLRSRAGQKRSVIISSDEEDAQEEDSDGLEIVGAPPKVSHPNDSDLGEAESSSDEVLASSPGILRKRRGVKKISEIYSEDEESDDVPPVTPRKRRAPTASEEESDEEVVVTQSRRRRSPDKQRLQLEREDLAEDIEFLGSTQRAMHHKSPKKSSPRPMNARQRALEALRRRRAGEKDADLEPAQSTQTRRKRALYDTESEPESDADDDEAEEDEDEPEDPIDEPRSTFHQASTMDMFQEDDEDENFVVEDGDDTIGVPDEELRLPLAFSSVSRMKGKDLFKYAVEWMVQKKLNPAFPISDEIYDLTFRKLDDEVKGLAGSKFTSSAWTPDFTRALHARPLIEISEISGGSRVLLENHCMACNRRSHPATFDITFRGKPYHRSTLEDVADDYDSDDDDDNRSCDSQGNEVPSEDTVFHVGVFCKTNAQTAHALAHWRYHLNEWVVDWLAAEKYLDPDKIVARDGWKTKKRMKYANEVVDEMERKGEIRRLYQDFRTEIDTARNAKASPFFVRCVH